MATRVFSEFESNAWSDWRMDRPSDKFKMCLDIICIRQDSYIRLAFKFVEPKYEVLEVCRAGEGGSFDLAKVRTIASALAVKQEA